MRSDPGRTFFAETARVSSPNARSKDVKVPSTASEMVTPAKVSARIRSSGCQAATLDWSAGGMPVSPTACSAGTFLYIVAYVVVCMYIYIYMERERGRDYSYIYIYIYIYINYI